ncbi:hypothetical protein GGR52DRAFT_45770 [Hypoxylon sp. FL1284]|nr:hypothetical protein GGR52DRAFT_45770 [Hypoxylon sp. FL1284]
MSPRITVIAAAEGLHVPFKDQASLEIWDPRLALEGFEQCDDLVRDNAELVKSFDTIYSSPSMRAIQTAQFLAAASSTDASPKKVYVDLELRAANPSYNCNRFRRVEVLQELFGESIELMYKQGLWSWTPARIEELLPEELFNRGLEIRRRIRELCREDVGDPSATNPHFVLVSHKGFIPYLTGDYFEFAQWFPGTFRTYQFADSRLWDVSASWRETRSSLLRRGENTPYETGLRKIYQEGADSARIRQYNAFVDPASVPTE